MSTVEFFRAQLMALPAPDRATLATLLLASLDAELAGDKTHEAWKEIAESRSAAYSQGQLEASDWRESVERIRHRIIQRRNLTPSMG